MLNPSYGEGVEEALDKVENDPDRRRLWIKIVETLDFILDHPDDERAGRYAMRTPEGEHISRVPIYSTGEDQDWCVMWAIAGDLARFLYVGPWPPAIAGDLARFLYVGPWPPA